MLSYEIENSDSVFLYFLYFKYLTIDTTQTLKPNYTPQQKLQINNGAKNVSIVILEMKWKICFSCNFTTWNIVFTILILMLNINELFKILPCCFYYYNKFELQNRNQIRIPKTVT